MKSKIILSLGILLPVISCNGPKYLETRINSRPVESLAATATYSKEFWTVELPLPAGTWTVKADEEQPSEIILGNPRSVLRWRVSPARWSQFEKPVIFILTSDSGPSINMSLRYPRPNDVIGNIVEGIKILTSITR